jgi:hypothetical protein
MDRLAIIAQQAEDLALTMRFNILISTESR